MSFLPVEVRGDSNAQLRGICAVLRQMPTQVQPRLMPEVCQVVPSTRAYEEFVHVNAVPKVQKKIVGNIGGTIVSIKQTITIDRYEAELEIDGDDFDDDQIGMYQPFMAELGQSLLLAPDELVSTNLIANGESINSFDGIPFYATTHKFPNGEYTTSQSNKQSGTGLAPDQIENDWYLALTAMANWKDDRGRLRIPPQDLEDGKLIVHYSPTATIEQSINRVFGVTAGGDAQDIPITNSTTGITVRKSALSGKAKLMRDGYLTGNSWYVHSTSGIGNAKPFAFLDREGPRVDILSRGSEHFIKEKTILVKGTRRFGLGVLRPERSQKVYNA